MNAYTLIWNLHIPLTAFSFLTCLLDIAPVGHKRFFFLFGLLISLISSFSMDYGVFFISALAGSTIHRPFLSCSPVTVHSVSPCLRELVIMITMVGDVERWL